MSNPILIKNYLAGDGVAAYRIVAFSADNTVVQAAAATDAMIGVSDNLAKLTGERVDITLSGLAEVMFGGTVARGALVTSDADGKAVAAAPAAGVNNRVIGVAMVAAVSGDIAPILIQPGSLQG